LSNIPEDLQYTASHEWVRRLPDGKIEVGITDHAQSALGDLVFVELPEVGRRLNAGESCIVVESVKAASDVYSPLGGEVIASNTELTNRPELLNEDPYGAGWLIRVELGSSSAGTALMNAAEYANFLAAEAR
jgi:glycine cleavage system H protein